MRKTFHYPYRLWLSIWLFISSALVLITLFQYNQYTRSTIARVQAIDFNMLHASLPYAIAFLEANHRTDLIPELLNSNFGFFRMIYTDLDNNVRYSTNNSQMTTPLNQEDLTEYKTSFVYKNPHPRQCIYQSPFDHEPLCPNITSQPDAEAYGKILLIKNGFPSFFQAITDWENWEILFTQGIFKTPSYLLNIIFNLLVFLGISFLFWGLFSSHKKYLQLQEEISREREDKLNELESDLKITKEKYNKAKAKAAESEVWKELGIYYFDEKGKIENEIKKLRKLRKDNKPDSQIVYKNRLKDNIVFAMKSLLPNVNFLQNSIETLLFELDDPRQPLKKLQQILYQLEKVKAKKFEGTKGFKEVHFGNEGRLYFRNKEGGDTEVLISVKAQQNRDARYLKAI